MGMASAEFIPRKKNMIVLKPSTISCYVSSLFLNKLSLFTLAGKSGGTIKRHVFFLFDL